jgi:catechol 2,3-dioxygenase-like lactoylglutathione lyase family enzyme
MSNKSSKHRKAGDVLGDAPKQMAVADPTLTGIAPQFLVDDLRRSIEYYRQQLGFELDFVYENFYASVTRGGCAIHLKEAAKTESDRSHRRQHEHLDAFIAVTNAGALHDELQGRGAVITRPLEVRPWSARDFYVEDPDGYILCFSESRP